MLRHHFVVNQTVRSGGGEMTGGTGTCHTSDFPFDICVKSIFQDITFSVFAYYIGRKSINFELRSKVLRSKKLKFIWLFARLIVPLQTEYG